jgi:hypothetical protein
MQVASPVGAESRPTQHILTQFNPAVRVYAAPILVGSFLLFLVQPMLAKVILPWFGGVAGVWVVAMLFFQGMLLVGYGYAYLMSRFLPSRLQPVCHFALLLGSLALMPVSPWRTWQAGVPGDPSMQILRVLLLSTGLPYLLLSTTGPLIQTWYAQTHRVALPYRLFALSNFGSLLALLAYPVVIEPYLTTRHQMLVWSVLYGAFVILCGVAAVDFWHSRPNESAPVPSSVRSVDAAAPARRDYVMWAALAACGSGLLVTVMNHVCQNVAPIPLLWVLPLGTYLLTFILAFDRQGWYQIAYMRWLLPLALGAMTYGIFQPDSLPGVRVQVLAYLGSLLVACLFCHGELARRKPHARYLTSFYLMIALGGAAASVAIGLIAPRVSTWRVEFPETVALCGILALVALYPRNWIGRVTSVALLVFLALLAAGFIHVRNTGLILQARDFYGAVTVTEETLQQDHPIPMRILYNGTIQHGMQFLDPAKSGTPTAYYGPLSGIGLLLRARHDPWVVGVVGLGAGTLAAYSRPADSFTFYEIDPLVSDIAQRQFSFLKAARGPVKIEIGDGRLSLQKETDGRFNVVVIDAFSGDSIPTHLLTREAFELYFSKLKPDGVVAVHISNKFVDLKPVLAAVSHALNKRAVETQSKLTTEGAVFATWVLIGNGPDSFRRLPPNMMGDLAVSATGSRLWTDDYSNVLQLLK